MFVHSVYFWLKEDLSEADRARFGREVRGLLAIPSVVQGFVGAPADTDRPVIDRSYSCALIVVFKDQAGHDLYQDHPIHDAFRIGCAPLWHRVVIYDAQD